MTPSNGLERLEWNNIFWYLHKRLLLIGTQNRVDFKRSHPVRKFRNWKNKCSNGNLVQQLGTRIRAVDWCWECCDICWNPIKVWVYMTWHSEHGMGQMWAPKDSPAAGAIRPWPDQEAYEGKDGAANETLATYFWHCLLYTSPSPRDKRQSRMPSSA